MPQDSIPGCIILTEDNVDRIVAAARTRGFTIEYLRDNMTYHLEEDGSPTMLYTSYYPWNRQMSTFNDVPFDPSTDEATVPLMNIEEFLALIHRAKEVKI